ncbi:MAG TPA: SRPBCC family protein [Candidatus Saccharimonadales bacterium]|nr:SRPBCC family protein [Candidatus Saccharimonadales bacterium]
MHDYTTEIHINAPADKVWDALTDPQLLSQYLSDTSIDSDWQKGSAPHITHQWEGEVQEDKAVVLEAEPNKLLKLSYLPALADLPDTPDNYQQITATLAETDGHTLLRIEVLNIRDDFYGQRAPELWGEILGNIKKTIEG